MKGEYHGAKIVDDYAHHPSEIKATLDAARKIHNMKLIVAFQPHTYTRTRELLNEFATAFEYADEVLITDIYAAREQDDHTVHSKDLVQRINLTGKKATYFESFDAATAYLSEFLGQGHLLFTMGAGDIHVLGERLIDKNTMDA